MQLNIFSPLAVLSLLFVLALPVALIIVFAKPIVRYIFKLITDHMATLLLTEKYDRNLIELLPSIQRFSILNLVELSLRAEEGKVIKRPLGSPKQLLGFENLMFNPRQMTSLTVPEDAEIDMSVVLGSNSEKPMKLSIPLMIGGMAYGLALSAEAKLALAKASKMLQTATGSGEGPFLPEEAKAAGKFVLQICRWHWGERTAEQIAASDMLEVQMGQGADIGADRIAAAEFTGRAQRLSGLALGQDAVGIPTPTGVKRPEDWPLFMSNLRKRAKGIPIALKLMATDRIEEELSVALELGFDAVILDGSGGGSHATAPIKQDDFGIPSLNALIRARRFLGNKPISLIVAGKYFTPGQCLKAIALGADAIYLGTVPLLALAHKQIEKVLPWEPITTLIYYDSKTKTKLDINKAAHNVANVLSSMVLEMQEAMRGLGKTSLKQMSSEDLVALDAVTAEATGIKTSFKPQVIPTKYKSCSSKALGLAKNQKRFKVNKIEEGFTKLPAEQLELLKELEELLQHSQLLISKLASQFKILKQGILPRNYVRLVKKRQRD